MLALTAHLVVATVLVRRGPPARGAGEAPEAPHVPVVFIPPRPQIVPRPSPPPVPPPAPLVPAAAPAEQVVASSSGAAAAPPRPPDLVFQIDAPEDTDPGEPRVAGTAGVTLPEVAPESQEEARRIQDTPRRGWVVLRVLVRLDGSVEEVTPEGGGDAEAAARMAPAVRELRFRPALQRGRPVNAWFTMVWPPG